MSKHGLHGIPEYWAWKSMKKRCYNRNHDSYQWYGGRGISVCSRWRDSFPAFLEDVGRKPGPRYSLDRIDVNGNYEPGNVRWVTQKVQQNNKRSNRHLVVNGVSKTVSEWADHIGVHQSVLKNRVRSGWSDERIVSEPVRNSSKRIVVNAIGLSLTIQEWASRTGIPRATIYRRIRVGWPACRAVTKGRRSDCSA